MRKYIIILSMVVYTNLAFAQGEKSSKETQNGPDLPGIILVDFGFNNYSNFPSELSINSFKSKSFGMYYMKSYKMGNKMTFNPAIGINFEKHGFSNEQSIGYDDGINGSGVSIIDLDGYDDLKKSRLAANYLDISIQLRYYFKDNDSKRGTYLAFGPIASVLLESHTKVKFTEDGRNQTIKHRDDFQLNKIRYAAQTRFGFGSVNFFYKHYFSSLFNNNGPEGATDITAHTIGISISGL